MSAIVQLEISLIRDELNRRVPARLRRELRNPSMVTVLIIIVAVLAVPLTLLVPSWISTTKSSLQKRDAAGAQRDAAILSASSLVSSHILPWMLNEVKELETADDPESWHSSSFTLGPCDSTNLSNLPAGNHADAIAEGCTELRQIQLEYSSDCITPVACNVSDAALTRLSSTRQKLIDTFTGAGFVSDYNGYDERWMR